MPWFSEAPSNIALIKYMGKKDTQSNLPDNSSLSYTLGHLQSRVKLETISGDEDCWQPLLDGESKVLSLSTTAQTRFITHLKRLKDFFGYSGSFLIQSNNNFPQGSGLASSASSFAALTRCAVSALSELTHQAIPTINEQAYWSRLGSGSSCRSFYSPWVLWQENDVSAVDLPYANLIHKVIVVSDKEKLISSSEAHQRVRTSPFYQTRAERAEARLTHILDAFRRKNWAAIYESCWDEFQDMHHLFTTCEQPFSYINQESQTILSLLRSVWEKNNDGPIVTMDAGPNIHLLYQERHNEWFEQFNLDYLGQYHVL